MTPVMPSDRKFGWTFAAVFLLVGAVYYPWLMALAGVIAIVTLTRAEWLSPAKHAWMKLGDILGRIVSPIVLGVIYFAIFTPVAVAMRLAKRDVLKLRLERSLPTYWNRRDPPGPADDSFKEPY